MPEDPISASDGEVKGLGCLAEDGTAAVGGEKVKVLIDVVEGDIVRVGVDGLGTPDLRGNVDDKGGRFDSGAPHEGRGTHGAY